MNSEKRNQDDVALENETATLNAAKRDASIINNKCKRIPCGKIKGGDIKYNGYCHDCYYYLNPLLKYPNCKNTREKVTITFIINEFSEYNWILNRKISTNWARPDAALKLNDRWIIVEIDEDQHKKKSYNKLKERVRAKSLIKALEPDKVYVIRFNPDSYICNIYF